MAEICQMVQKGIWFWSHKLQNEATNASVAGHSMRPHHFHLRYRMKVRVDFQCNNFSNFELRKDFGNQTSLATFSILHCWPKLTYWWSDIEKLSEEITNTTKVPQTNSYVCIEMKWIENKIITVLMFMSVRLSKWYGVWYLDDNSLQVTLEFQNGHLSKYTKL